MVVVNKCRAAEQQNKHLKTQILNLPKKEFEEQVKKFETEFTAMHANSVNTENNDMELAKAKHKIINSYVKALKTTRVEKKLTDKTIIIKPNVKQDGKTTNGKIKEQVNPADSKVGFSRMQSIRDGGLIVTCSGKERNKLKTVVNEKLGYRYIVNKMQLKNTRIKIVGMETQLTEEELKKCIGD